MFIALTGGIGCGKSAALQGFAQCGLRIADADKICHRFYETCEGIEAVGKRWPSVIDDSGNIDRKKLGNIVFRDENDLAYLESLVTPFLLAELEKIRSSNHVTVVEIPLLFEKNMQHTCDATIAVWSPFALRRKRLAARNWDHNECARRERLQWSPEAKLAAADYGIINHGSLESLYQQCKLISEKILSIHNNTNSKM